MKDLGRIRRLFYRDGMSLSEISRKTGYSRNTVKRWLRTAEGTEPKYERQNPNVKIAPGRDKTHFKLLAEKLPFVHVGHEQFRRGRRRPLLAGSSQNALQIARRKAAVRSGRVRTISLGTSMTAFGRQ